MDKIVNIQDYDLLRDFIYFEESDLKIKLVYLDNLVITFEGSVSNKYKFKYYRVVIRTIETMEGYKIVEAHPFKLHISCNNKIKDKRKRKLELQRIINEIVEECCYA